MHLVIFYKIVDGNKVPSKMDTYNEGWYSTDSLQEICSVENFDGYFITQLIG